MKALVDLDYFECMSWVQAKGNNAWHHETNLKKGEWRTIEFKMADMHLGWMVRPSPEKPSATSSSTSPIAPTTRACS
jgi:hypothetical protein